MMKIEVRGVIAPPEFDTPDAADFVERGLLTPTSKTERELSEANGADVRLYMNSQGGDCLAGNALLDAIRAYNGNLTIEVGALCASEAANIVLQSGRETVAHSNSIFLFHSARALVEGGAQALRDEARFVELLNAPIMAALAAHGVPQADIDAGFAEGREFLMGARDALEYGIVSRILEDTAEAPVELSEADGAAILSAVDTEFPLAAYAPLKYGMNDETITEPVEERKPCGVDVEPTETAEDTRLADLAANVETLKATIAEMENTIADLRGENAALATAKETEAKAAETARAEVAELRAKLATENQRRAALVGGVLRASAADGDAPHDWREAVKACNGDLKLAFARYAHLARAWRDTH